MKKTLIITTAIIAVLFVGFATSDNDFFVGDGADTDKKIGVNIGSGATNPFIKYNTTDDVWQFSNDGTKVADFGSGSGGGGAINWSAEAGSAPLTDIDSAIGYYIFEQGITQKLTAIIKVPASYTPGTQITMLNYVFKDGVSNNYAMQTVTTLIRPSLDAIDSTLNQVSNTTSDLQAATPKLLTEFTTSLTTGIGEINGQAVGPGDLLKVELSRVVPSGTDTTDDIKFIPDSTEVSFGL